MTPLTRDNLMTSFAAAAPQEPLFAEALHKYFAGRRDPLTLAKL
ncbi:DUF1810 family protein [Methylocystis hirsuta]|nr:DUF1810 family protein [Methylocystis hirsuta]